MGAVQVTLKRWRWLKNNGVTLEYEGGDGLKGTRFVRPNGAVSVHEAAMILGTYDVHLYRLKRAGKLKMERHRGRLNVRVSELLRLKREPEIPGVGANR